MRSLLVIGMIGLAGTAWGDEVTLSDGRVLVGIVRESVEAPGWIRLEMGAGVVTLRRENVLAIRRGRTALHEYYDRWAEARDSKNVAELTALFRFASRHGFTRFQDRLLERILRLDPENACARKARGQEMFRGKWMTREEIRRAQGLVFFEGRWMTTAERALRISDRLDRGLRYGVKTRSGEPRFLSGQAGRLICFWSTAAATLKR